MGKVIDIVCVCLFVRALKGKRPELSTPNWVHVYCMAGHRYVLTPRSKGQRSRSRGNALQVRMSRRGYARRYDCFRSLLHALPVNCWMFQITLSLRGQSDY